MGAGIRWGSRGEGGGNLGRPELGVDTGGWGEGKTGNSGWECR